MKKFLSNVLGFTGLLLLFLSVKTILIPKSAGNDIIHQKLKYFKEFGAEHNFVAFGSSRIYRQLNCELVDSLLNHRKLSMYNFGARATFNPEAYFHYLEFLDNEESNSIKYAIVELQHFALKERSNLLSSKGSTWISPEALTYSFDYIESLEPESQKELKWSYSLATIYKFFNLEPIFLNLFSQGFDKGTKGFYPMEQELKETGKKRLLKRNSNLLRDSSVLKEYLEENNNVQKYHSVDFNKAHLKIVNKMLTKSQEKGIKLLFLLPPRLRSKALHKIVPVFNQIPSGNRISPPDLTQYPQFYHAKYLFDYGHFNLKGSDLYTKYVALEIEKLLTNKRSN